MDDNYSFGALLNNAETILENTYSTGLSITDTPDAANSTIIKPEEQAPSPVLNRAQRRAQEKKLRKIAKMIETQPPRKAKDLAPEEQLQIKRNLLARLKEENAKFAKLKEEEEKKTNE